LKVTKDESSARQVTLEVELDSDDLEPYLERAYKRNRNQVHIPGFRPGKAPRYIVETFLGREALVRDSLDFIVQESLDKAIKDEELDTFGQPDVEVMEMNPVSFKATVPLEPLVEFGDLRKIDAAREPVDITEEQVGRVLEQLRYNAAPWEPADRTVQFGDLVTLNVSGTISGEQVADDQGVDFVPSQDNPYPFPGFSVYLEGLAKEEDREFTLTVPEDFHDTTIAGKECLFKVKALEIKTKNLPELDDEFAKGIEDGYEGLEALRTSILENLTADSERLSTRDFQEKALEEVISGASIEISEATMEREIDHLLEDQARGQQGRQGDVETYVQNAGKTREELREELRPAAKERLHRYLVIRKISQDEGLEVSPEEVNTEVEELTASASGSSEALLQAFSSEDARSSLGSAILTRKVLERLIQRIEEPEEAPADSLETEGESEPEVTEEPMDDSPTVEENTEEEPSESST